MNTVKLAKLPDCDICGDALAAYDGPTKNGAWGYMCAFCFRMNGSPKISTKLEVRDVTGDNAEASPKSAKMVNSIDDACFNSVIELECPSCKEVHRMEIDFDGKYTCEGCQQKLIYRNTIC